MIEESSLWQTSASTAPGTLRWKAPELLTGEQKTVTIQSDMYAYGMTCLVGGILYINSFLSNPLSKAWESS
jgi:serine/threonine protein kinase